jgi:hypothetical protein
MIVCSNCKHINLAGALFCAECGSRLAGGDRLITHTITDRDEWNKEIKNDTGERYQQPSASEAWGSLHLVDTGQVFALSSRNEFTLGRASEGQPIMPDIDLSPYQAYAAGVSRLHAVIKRVGPQMIFMDLGSANGSYLNGGRLTPNVEMAVEHGDIVALGKLKIQILIKK